jgi:hypothetical protein
MSLQIIKLSNKSWKHVDTIDGAFILTKFYAKTENDKFIIVEVYGSKRREYLASEITITDIGGSPEIFTNLEDLILRLEQLKYTGFYLDGEINPTDYDLEDFQNNSTDPFARISDIVGGGEWGSITGTLSDQTDLQDALDDKQNTLVSGTNIKTINGTTLLGSGDLVVGTNDIFNDNNFLNWRTIKFEALGGNQSAIQSYLGSLLNTGTATTKTSTFNSTNFIGTVRRVGLVSASTVGSSIQRRLSSGVPCSVLSGFYFCSDTICSDASTVATRRFLVGLGTTFFGGIGNIEPSTSVSCIMLAYDSTDSNMQIMHNDNSGTCTKIDLGSDFPARTLSTDLYRLELVTLPNTSIINYRVTRINTGHTATGTLTTNIPSTSTPLTLGFWANNGSTSLAVDEAFSQITITTPY